MKWIVIILLIVAMVDITKIIIKLVPERKMLKKAWQHNKRQFMPIIYSILCDILAAIVFIDYMWRWVRC